MNYELMCTKARGTAVGQLWEQLPKQAKAGRTTKRFRTKVVMNDNETAKRTRIVSEILKDSESEFDTRCFLQLYTYDSKSHKIPSFLGSGSLASPGPTKQGSSCACGRVATLGVGAPA